MGKQNRWIKLYWFVIGIPASLLLVAFIILGLVVLSVVAPFDKEARESLKDIFSGLTDGYVAGELDIEG